MLLLLIVIVTSTVAYCQSSSPSMFHVHLFNLMQSYLLTSFNTLDVFIDMKHIPDVD